MGKPLSATLSAMFCVRGIRCCQCAQIIVCCRFGSESLLTCPITARPTRPICDTAIFGDVPLRQANVLSAPRQSRKRLSVCCCCATQTWVLCRSQQPVQTPSAASCEQRGSSVLLQAPFAAAAGGSWLGTEMEQRGLQTRGMRGQRPCSGC